MTSFDDEATGHLEWVTVSHRRDRLVAGACLCLVVLQALPYVAVGWITDGGTAAGDGALYALAPTSLLGVVGFGVVLAVALSRPAMEPVVRTGSAVDGPVVPRLPTWPRPPTVTTGACLPRLRWAALAALAEAATVAGAALLESAASSGASAAGHALDDGSVLWAYLGTVCQVLLMDVRAPTAGVVAFVVLVRARRPVSPRRARRTRRSLRARRGRAAAPAARTTRPCRDRPPS